MVADKVAKAPIPHAFAYVRGGPRRADSIPPVDGLGRFQVLLAPGPTTFLLHLQAFSLHALLWKSRPGKTVKYDPRLGADNEHLQQ